METLRTTFFEDPLYVYIALAFAELVLAAIWYERRNRRWTLALLAPVVAGGVVWAVSTMVVTDRERIVSAARRIARDLEVGSVASAGEYLDDNYRGLGLDKQGALAAGKAAIGAYRIRSIRFTRLSVEVESRQAAMRAATVIEYSAREFGSAQSPLVWRVRWIKRPVGWRILEVEEPQQKLEF
jgi:hypothetical protein